MTDEDDEVPCERVGLSHGEIARLLGIPKADVVRIETRALAKLRVAAERAGVTWQWRPSEPN